MDAISAADQLPSLSILDSSAPSTKVRPGNLSDVTPSNTSEMENVVVHDKSKQRYFNHRGDGDVVSQVEDKELFDSHQHEVRLTFGNEFSLLSKKQNAKCETALLQPELDVSETHREQHPQFLKFQRTHFNMCLAERLKMEACVSEAMQSISGTGASGTSTQPDRDTQRSGINDDGTTQKANLTDPKSPREALPRYRSAGDWQPETRSSKVPVVSFVPERDVSLRQGLGVPLLQLQYCTLPVLNTGNPAQYMVSQENIQDMKEGSMTGGVGSNIPVLSIEKSNDIGSNITPAGYSDIQMDNGGARQTINSSEIINKTSTSTTNVQSADVGSSRLHYSSDLSRFVRGLGMWTADFSHHEQIALGPNGTLPYDAPITDFEISNGGFDDIMNASRDASKLGNAGIEIPSEGVLSHMSDADLVATNKKTRGRPEAAGDDDAPLSRWRKKRQKTNNVGLSSDKDENGRAEQMKLQRALRNRESARRSRIKSKVHFQNMERRYAELSEDNVGLTTLVDSLLPPSMKLVRKESG